MQILLDKDEENFLIYFNFLKILGMLLNGIDFEIGDLLLRFSEKKSIINMLIV